MITTVGDHLKELHIDLRFDPVDSIVVDPGLIMEVTHPLHQLLCCQLHRVDIDGLDTDQGSARDTKVGALHATFIFRLLPTLGPGHVELILFEVVSLHVGDGVRRVIVYRTCFQAQREQSPFSIVTTEPPAFGVYPSCEVSVPLVPGTCRGPRQHFPGASPGLPVSHRYHLPSLLSFRFVSCGRPPHSQLQFLRHLSRRHLVLHLSTRV